MNWEFPGAIHYVTSRMVGSWRDERLRLFRDARITGAFWSVWARESNLPRFMQKLSTAYTVYSNLRHREHGHLFEGRFKAKLMEGDKVLEEVARGLGESVAAFRERRRNSPMRAIAGRLLAKYAGMRQREIASVLGMGSGAAVSVQARRCDRWL